MAKATADPARARDADPARARGVADPGRAHGAADSVRVRMYRVGFGDCFLVRFPGPRYMLVDCGSVDRGPALKSAARDILEETGGKIHVVVASHRHRDHVNGFSQLAALWNRVEVEEVWLPWVEDPEHAAAAAIRHRLDDIADGLLRLAPSARIRRLAQNALTDDAAMDVLAYGFAGSPRRRYLSAEDEAMGTDTLPGVHVHVGGPTRSDAYLHRADVECTMAEMALLELERRREREGPLAERWVMGRAEAQRLFRAELRPPVHLPEDDSGGGTDALAYRLDQALNNTSLALFLRCGRARLLFAGDCCGEAWLPFLERHSMRDELGRIDFYKVAHHGSHNGSPARLVEGLGGRQRGTLHSMLSTRIGEWPSIPHGPLVRDLQRLGPVARSDAKGRAPGFARGEDWVDLELPV